MPSTQRPTLASTQPALARHSTYAVNAAGHSAQTLTVVGLAATDTLAVFAANGPAYITRIDVVPSTTYAIDGTNNWSITAYNGGTDGLGSTAIGSAVTNATVAKTALVRYNAYSAGNNPGTLVNDGTVVYITATKASSPAALDCQVIVYYANIIP